MSEDRPAGTVAVVDHRRLHVAAVRAIEHHSQALIERGVIERIDVLDEDAMNKRNAMLATVLAATATPSLLDRHMPPTKRPKDVAPQAEQERRIAEAQRKRERRLAKRRQQRGST